MYDASPNDEVHVTHLYVIPAGPANTATIALNAPLLPS